jgi:hypothetical protein
VTLLWALVVWLQAAGGNPLTSPACNPHFSWWADPCHGETIIWTLWIVMDLALLGLLIAWRRS